MCCRNKRGSWESVLRWRAGRINALLMTQGDGSLFVATAAGARVGLPRATFVVGVHPVLPVRAARGARTQNLAEPSA